MPQEGNEADMEKYSKRTVKVRCSCNPKICSISLGCNHVFDNFNFLSITQIGVIVHLLYIVSQDEVKVVVT